MLPSRYTGISASGKKKIGAILLFTVTVAAIVTLVTHGHQKRDRSRRRLGGGTTSREAASDSSSSSSIRYPDGRQVPYENTQDQEGSSSSTVDPSEEMTIELSGGLAQPRENSMTTKPEAPIVLDPAPPVSRTPERGTPRPCSEPPAPQCQGELDDDSTKLQLCRWIQQCFTGCFSDKKIGPRPRNDSRNNMEVQLDWFFLFIPAIVIGGMFWSYWEMQMPNANMDPHTMIVALVLLLVYLLASGLHCRWLGEHFETDYYVWTSKKYTDEKLKYTTCSRLSIAFISLSALGLKGSLWWDHYVEYMQKYKEELMDFRTGYCDSICIGCAVMGLLFFVWLFFAKPAANPKHGIDHPWYIGFGMIASLMVGTGTSLIHIKVTSEYISSDLLYGLGVPLVVIGVIALICFPFGKTCVAGDNEYPNGFKCHDVVKM